MHHGNRSYKSAVPLQDVGIDNGLHRVVQNLPAVRAADVVIVVAGMDGSLPSVIAGLVDSPVVRVRRRFYGNPMLRLRLVISIL